MRSPPRSSTSPDLRRYGAATLDLAWIAAGRLDAYWERDLSPWDLAAGMLLVREAGGFVTDLDGGDAVLAKGQVAAGNDTMHRELIAAAQGGRQRGRKGSRHRSRQAGGNAVSCRHLAAGSAMTLPQIVPQVAR